MIKNALSVLPTRPVLYIVPAIIVVVMSFYYRGIYTDCTHDKQFRVSLNEILHATDSATPFRLDDLTGFSWDKVRIVNNFKPERKIMDCPFGWDWSAAQRRDLISSNLLGVLIFAHKNIIVDYIEFQTDQILFEEINTTLPPDKAVFKISKDLPNTSAVYLGLIKN